MKILQRVFTGILIAIVSIGLLLGVFSLSLAEANSTATPTLTPTDTSTPTSSPTWEPFTPTSTATRSPDTPTPSSTWTPTQTLTPPPTSRYCPPPSGWIIYFVQTGESIDSIAVRYQISSSRLQNANCLLTTDLIPGVVIYVPPSHTQTPLPCGAPGGWTIYYVQPGDTLYRLSQTYGTTVARLQSANCMGASTLLHTGQILYVPPGDPRGVLPPASGGSVATATPTNGSFTGQPSDTPAPAVSDTPAEVPTATTVPTT